MPAVRSCEVPLNSLLRSYKDGEGFADCYVTEVSAAVTQEQFIEAFYTSPLFKVERMILTYMAAMPATDDDARQLATGKTLKFSAWRVEGQSPSELLLTDFRGRTRSWLMTARTGTSSQESRTLLYFGSAVVPHPGQEGAAPRMGWLFHTLMGFHRIYSRLLLSAASRRSEALHRGSNSDA